MAITTALLVVMWSIGELTTWWAWLLYIWQCFMAVTVAVMAHNHNHLSIWKNKWLNIITDNWITMFYGFPAFAWIPTHNTNHHVHVNKEPDYTKTYALSEKLRNKIKANR